MLEAGMNEIVIEGFFKEAEVRFEEMLEKNAGGAASLFKGIGAGLSGMARGNGIVGRALKPGTGFLSNIANEWKAGLSGAPRASGAAPGVSAAASSAQGAAAGGGLQKGVSSVNYKGKDYTYGGSDAKGNPIWHDPTGAAHPAPGHISNAYTAGGGAQSVAGGRRPMFGGDNGYIRFTPGKGLKRGLYGGVAGSMLPVVGTGAGAAIGGLTGTFGTMGTGLLGAGALGAGAMGVNSLLGGGGGGGGHKGRTYGPDPTLGRNIIPGMSDALVGGLGGAAAGYMAGNELGVGGLLPAIAGGIAGYKYLPQLTSGGDPLGRYSTGGGVPLSDTR
jgi:hypothetical protein